MALSLDPSQLGSTQNRLGAIGCFVLLYRWRAGPRLTRCNNGFITSEAILRVPK